MIHAPIGPPLDFSDADFMLSRKTGPLMAQVPAGRLAPLQFNDQAVFIDESQSGRKREATDLEVGEKNVNGSTSFRQAITNNQVTVVEVSSEVKSEKCHRWQSAICCFRQS
uniref:Uncharacterized protein n=1 Tax=Plectus sambesii TaxID=2011161 RepID=A0A914XR95_9BILA